MQRDLTSGILLLAGSLVLIIIIVLHPTAHGMMAAEDFPAQSYLNAIVHGSALTAVPVLFLGLLGLSRRIGYSHLVLAAIVAYGFAVVAVLGAGLASGFVAPHVMARALDSGQGSGDLYQVLLFYTGLWNQAFAKVHVAASSVAIVLWSAAILRTRSLPRPLGIVGIVIGTALTLGLLAGHLRLNVHGVLAVVAAQGIWTIWAGILLCRRGR